MDLSTLPLEILVNIALQMTIPEVLFFGSLSKRIHRKVCQRKYFWILLLSKENLNISPQLIYKNGKFNWLLYFLLKYPEKDWNWWVLSKNPNITWEIVQANPHRKWNWYRLSANPNIALEIVQANSHRKWNWYRLSANPNNTWEIIYNNPNEPWEWSELSDKNSEK